MKFINDYSAYLVGRTFSSRLSVEFQKEEQTTFDRIEILKNIVKDKKVIHLGCADHLNLIDFKIKHNIWLHKILMENTQKCIGIDINQEAIDYLKTNHKIKGLYVGNILEMSLEKIETESWDYIILGEIIEHIDNPVEFLHIIHERLKPFVRGIILTAPNAWSLQIIKQVKKNVELINSDHRYWFTPYTLSKVLVKAGFVAKDVHFSYFSMPKYNFLKVAYKKRHYLQADSLIAVAEF